MYSLAEQANIFNPLPAPGNWTFSTAANDVFAAVTPLRSVTVAANTFDIQTYVVGLGDTVANPSSIAALNEMANKGGTVRAYLAADTASLAAAFLAISNDIAGKTSAAASVSLNSGSFQVGTTVLYQAKFNSGDWTGQLLAYAINPDGSLGAQQWDAGQAINGQNWNTGRVVLTYKPSGAFNARGIPFRWPAAPATPTATEMDMAQSTELAHDGLGIADASGPDRVKYLRGDTSRESLNCPACVPNFRSRPVSRLGDIIHSAPYYVASPPFGYPDTLETAPYSAFANLTRSPTIYVGANDGMLHAFDAASGREVLAYVPTPVYRNLSLLTGQSFSNSAGGPHHYFVDGSPTVGDYVDSLSNSWRTLLVGGMAAGGQGFYALDVTDPGAFSEANAGGIVRWEFTDANDADLGYGFGQPLIVKTKNGWAVIVANGYNNTDADGHASTTGHAVLFVLDAHDGSVMAKIDTNVGTVANPNGLSGAIAVDSTGGYVADTVYAGDLYGNMWKFDLSAANPAGWAVAFSGSPLFTTPGNQPITMRPDVTKYPDRWLCRDIRHRPLSRCRGSDDDGDADVLRHPGRRRSRQRGRPGASIGRGNPDGTRWQYLSGYDPCRGSPDRRRRQSRETTRYRARATTRPSTVGISICRILGERSVSEAAIRAGRVIFNTLIPNSDPCSYGGTGWVMEVDVMTGNRFDTPTFDIDNNQSITGDDRIAYSSGHDVTSGRAVTSIPAAAGFLGIPKKKGEAAVREQVREHFCGHRRRDRRNGGAGNRGPRVVAPGSMRRENVKRTLLASMLIAMVTPALAITPANVQGPVQGPVRLNAATPAPNMSQQPPGGATSPAVKPPAVKPPPVTPADAKKHADDSSGMRRGVVQKVDVAKGNFHVYGQSVSFDPKQVRVIGANGKPTSIHALKQGANVRFTLDPTDPKHKRAAVIYVN